MKRSGLNICIFAVFLMAVSFTAPQRRPVIFLIGDSTVKNGKGKGDAGQWGWGSVLEQYFDTTRIDIQNRALGGTSTRTFISKGLWRNVLDQLNKDDYLVVQFGHNDGGPLDDTARARGTIKGIGDEVKTIYNPLLRQEETVHTYGWYLTKMIQEAKQKGAHVIICSPIPRDRWKDHKVERAEGSYPAWAEQVAQNNKVPFIDLHNLVADEYDKIGKEKVAAYFTAADHTHTSYEGAQKNAQIVVQAIKELNQTELRNYLLP
ncbi:rhamnogalacturonan acetylesterase [Sphingobacterium spiritivorum]|nr:rhamnogalacturonan acetylesterase [Sphingobacterium spiritivorum]